MPGEKSIKSTPPAWYVDGIDHVWLPYAQMKTVSPPLPVVGSEGARLRLADGRELIRRRRQLVDRLPWLQPPAYPGGGGASAQADAAFMFGGLAHEQALTLAKRLAALLPGDLIRVFFPSPGRSRSKSR